MKDNVTLNNTFLPKGKVTVEVFDEQGSLISKQQKNNFISKGVRERLYPMLQQNIFFLRNNKGVDLLSEVKDTPFARMELRDFDGIEQPNVEEIIKGKLIGFANTNTAYAGSSSNQGTLNVVESSTDRHLIRLVYDFPTNCANGTFQSIYHTQEKDIYFFSTDYNASEKSSILYPKFPLKKSIQSGEFYDGYIYLLYDSNTLIKMNRNLSEILNTWTLNKKATGFTIKNNEIYMVERGNVPNGSILKVPLSNPEAVSTAVATVTGFNPNYNGKIGFYEDKIYVGNNLTIYKLDASYQILSSKAIRTEADENFWFSNGKGFKGGKVFDLETLETEAFRTAYAGSTFSQVVDGKVHITGTTLRSGAFPFVMFGSRALLDEPVTKTSRNTMKVTYDFIFDVDY